MEKVYETPHMTVIEFMYEEIICSSLGLTYDENVGEGKEHTW